MSRDYFSILGLTPGRYPRRRIQQRFDARRRRLLAQLDDPSRHAEVRQKLDDLHLAYNVLRDPQRQAEHLRSSTESEDPAARLRRLIEASLEHGLLRCSRRAQILAEGRRLGFSDFHTQLMIAQVQFGDGMDAGPLGRDDSSRRETASQVGARFAAAGVLALAIFLAVVRWLDT